MTPEKKPTKETDAAGVIGSSDVLDAVEREILAVVPDNCGLTTHDIAKRLGRSFGHNQRIYSGWILSKLLNLEKCGRIHRLDAEKPIVWTKGKASNTVLGHSTQEPKAGK